MRGQFQLKVVSVPSTLAVVTSLGLVVSVRSFNRCSGYTAESLCRTKHPEGRAGL